MKTRYVAAWSLLFTALFFVEYTSLLPRVWIPYDLAEFHFPLADYAFQSLKHGRFPQWDPTIYCGLSFTDNITAAIFYPPLWLMFALKWGSAKLSYQALQYLALAHVWLAFMLCYAWLHGRRKLHWLAAMLGAGGYAFGGYMLDQLQHLGFLAGYAWLPLAFSSIDEAEEGDRWRPLWKLALASSMCLLGGYPPFWLVFAVCAAVYALARQSGLRMGLWVAAALACSLAFSSIALLPAIEATVLKMPEVKYSGSSGFKHLEYYFSYVIPNYFKFDLGVDPATTALKDYLYLGAAPLAGLLLLFFRKKIRDVAPLLAVLLVSLILLTNPGGWIGREIEHTFLGQMTVDWDFYAGVSAALASLAAFGLDYGLRRASAKAPERNAAIQWAATLVIALALALAWSARLIVLWNTAGVASGAKSGLDTLGGLILCATLIYLFPIAGGRTGSAIAAALLLLSAAEYKAFGTSKQFDAIARKNLVNYATKTYPAINADTYAILQQHSEYRWAVEQVGPDPVRLRHFGFTTPQGFDPNLPAQYKKLIEEIGHFETNRLFDLYPEDPATLRLLGVGYVIVASESPGYAHLLHSPDFRLMQPDDSFYKVFELLDAQPPFGWEDGSHAVDVTEWQAERRGFRVRSPSGGVFRLSEQFYPGWTAKLDGAPVEIQRCHEAFQCVPVPPGEHSLQFRYRARWLIPGAALSLCSILVAILFVRSQGSARKVLGEE